MTTMLWKEFRENIKWAVLAMLGLGMAEFYALNQQQFFGFYVQESAPLCKSSFLMITTFGCAAVGLVLGLVQLLPEQRRDQWAALIHRPVERGTIYRGKAVAGLLLYLVATIVPFLGCIWYAATPNHFYAPFSPRMVYPGVADICAGAMYYFAALFVALRRGPWYGTRALGLLAAVAGSFIVASDYGLKFYVAIETTVYLSLALFTAAWGAMLSNGRLKDQPWLARVAALAVAFYGVVTIGVLLNMIWSAFQPQEYYFGQQYIIDIDGVPLKQQTGKDGHNTFTDLDGKAVNDPRLAKGMSYRNMINMERLTGYIGNGHGSSNRSNFDYGYRRSETYLEPLYVYDQVNSEAWYYQPRERIFSGFNRYSRVRVGSIGQDGFAPDLQPVAFFREPMVGGRYGQVAAVVQFGSAVYYFDAGQRTMTPLFSQPGVPVFGSSTVSSSDDQSSTQALAGIALTDRVEILDNKANLLATLPYDQDMDRWGSLSVGMKSIKGPLFLEYQPSEWIPWEESRKMPSYLEVFDPTGKLLKSYTLPHIDQVGGPRTWQQYVVESLQTPVFFYGNLIYEKIGAEVGSNRLRGQLEYALNQGWGYTKEIAIRITTLSAVLAVITLFWARYRQFSWRRAWAWAAFVLGFNLAGMIAFRLVSDWPVLVKCPACGRPRLVDRETCPHCHADWPVPPRDGTEIIEETPALANV